MDREIRPKKSSFRKSTESFLSSGRGNGVPGFAGQLCDRCFRACRLDGEENHAYCKTPGDPQVAFESVLFGEEPEISPSYGVYLPGCNLSCGFCLFPEMSHPETSYPRLNPDRLAERVREAEKRHQVRSVSLIGGEPTLHPEAVPAVKGAIPWLPLVLNINGLFPEKAADLFLSAVDLFLVDFHFGCDACATSIADAVDYMAILCKNLDRIYLAKPLILRFLLLPGHLECCLKPALSLLAKKWPKAHVTFLANYLPPAKSNGAPMEYGDRKLLDGALAVAAGAGVICNHILGI